jgi:plastocyanin
MVAREAAATLLSAMPPRRTLLLSTLLACALRAHGGTVDVTVTDAAAQPLAGAVVMLEPASGRLPTKPMTGVRIAQAQRRFDPAVTVVTVGTPIEFPNFDTVRHHVYSFSPAKTFELKLYAGVPSAPVVFDNPGIAVLGCNIHDRMAAWVVVVDTPLHARSGADGHARIGGVPPGRYRLRAWHPGLGAAAPAGVALEVGAADLAAGIALHAEPLR